MDPCISQYNLFHKIALITCKGVYLFSKPNQILIALIRLSRVNPRNRNICWKLFQKKAALRNFANFTGKKLWWSRFMNTCSLCFFKKNSNTGVYAKFWKTLLSSCFKEIAKGSQLINNIEISSYRFIYWSVKKAYCPSLSDLGYKKWKCCLQGHNNIKVRKNSITDLNFSICIKPILKPLNLERSRGNREINQVTRFILVEMLWKSVEHEGRGPGVEGRGLNKSNSLWD